MKSKKIRCKINKLMIKIIGISFVVVSVSGLTISKINAKDIRNIEYEVTVPAMENLVVENTQQINQEKIEQNYSYSDNGKEIEERINSWNFQREDGKKIAYLTFDDGPSSHVTNEILDVLKANDVKATFFVLGTSIERSEDSKNALRRIAEEGHSIGNHGYCHNYNLLYPNGKADVDFFMEDLHKTEKIINDTLGYSLNSKIIRMPGGRCSWEANELDKRLNDEGYAYIDWNTLNGDAEAFSKSEEQLNDELKETVEELYGNDDVIVVLMHDTDIKETTADSLDKNIKYLKSLGYEFRTIR